PPLDALDRVEIIRGASQVANGPQTVAGVINFVTRAPPTESTHGNISLGGGGAGFRNGHLWMGTGANGYGTSVDLTYRESDGIRREQAHRLLNLTANGTLPVSGNQSLTFK